MTTTNATQPAARPRTVGKYINGPRCPVCNCIVIVRRYGKAPASLYKALAMADHMKATHPVLMGVYMGVSHV